MGFGYQNLGSLDFLFAQGSGSGAGVPVIWTCDSQAQKRYLSRGCKLYLHEQGRCGLWGRMRSPGQAEKEVMGWGGRLGIDVGSKTEKKAVMSEGERGERENVLGISKGLVR